MNKNNLSESDSSDKYIRPAMVQAGWHTLDQIYAQFPLRAGRVVVRGNKSHRDESTVLKADFALFLKTNIPLAMVECWRRSDTDCRGCSVNTLIYLDAKTPRRESAGSLF